MSNLFRILSDFFKLVHSSAQLIHYIPDIQNCHSDYKAKQCTNYNVQKSEAYKEADIHIQKFIAMELEKYLSGRCNASKKELQVRKTCTEESINATGKNAR